MKYVSLIVSEDAAHSCVTSLGELGALQLTDLNPEQTPFQRRYVGYIKRCDELERKLRYMEKEVAEFGLRLRSDGADIQVGGRQLRGAALLDALEGELEKYEEQLLELTNYAKELTARYNEKIEFQECLEKGKTFFEAAAGGSLLPSDTGTSARSSTRNPLLSDIGAQPLLDEEPPSMFMGGSGVTDVGLMMRFSSSVGVVSATERARFERMLFRSSRGNCLVRFAEIDRPIADAATGAPDRKLVFIVFYKSEVIGQLVERVCAAFGARRYSVPDSYRGGGGPRWETVVAETRVELADAREVLLKNRELRLALCSRLSEWLKGWSRSIGREKAVYHALNMFKADVSGVLRGEGWIVSDAESEARALVTRAHAAVDLAGASMLEPAPKPWPQPPTYFETNSFTMAYQEFVDTYGVPRYKEINPALFTAFTFPFLFGMMYGDVGHGTCITVAGIYLIIKGEPKPDADGGDMLAGLASARYMLFMMGACAVYCGLIYNDCFSLALGIFDSTYSWGPHEKVEGGSNATRSNCDDGTCLPYPFGVDPAWQISDNELLFSNSMKMKTAVIVGICQMTIGIFLKGLNALYFKDMVTFFLEFLPMLIFDLSLFGYMVVLIFVKWNIDWDERMLMGSCYMHGNDSGYHTYDGKTCDPEDYSAKEVCTLGYGGDTNGCQPPNLINQLINIALSPGNVEEPMYKGQAQVQNGLLAIAFVCVPVLLLGRPLYVYLQRNDHHTALAAGPHQIEMHPAPGDEYDLEHRGALGGIDDDEGDHEEEHSVTEVLIHQCIETIEFVLGMISNTASYLRLWALSLAHSELAEVFWDNTMLSAVKSNPFSIFIAYAIFACVTTGVLLAMDVLECFLHALRLHWVEFQSKFYKADGYKFTPFTFGHI